MTATVEVSLLEQHPLSAAFPAMPEQELEALALDIEKNGQREPGVLFQGMVLDGWHRYLACQKAGRKFLCGDFAGDDPVSFVISKNLHRRHMTASQRGAAVVAAHNWRPHGDQSRSAAAADRSMKTTQEMAKEAEVSTRTIEHAKAAHAAGLGDQVTAGNVSAEQAAEVAKLPEAKREKALQAIKDGEPPKPKARSSDAEKLEARMKEMADELADLRESLAEMTALAESAKAFEEKDEFKEMQVLRLELKSCKRRRDELMAENTALKRDVIRWRKKVIGK